MVGWHQYVQIVLWSDKNIPVCSRQYLSADVLHHSPAIPEAEEEGVSVFNENCKVSVSDNYQRFQKSASV